MKFLAITDDVSVRKDEIVAVERNNIGLARVVLENVTYESNFPYETILQLLEMPGIEEKLAAEPQQMSLPEAYQRPMQYWNG